MQQTLVSTRNTDDAAHWLNLLSTLTDDELNRYGEIAQDQRNIEYDRWWMQVLCIVGAVCAFGWALRESLVSGGSRWVLLLLATSLALAIWPFRKARMRRMWNRHCQAVSREKARRQAVAD
ncbi:MAG: hypothetical protein ACR2PA_27440 [Hyphomicrobiaceae bacterium]